MVIQTPHVSANKEDIAKNVLMPGDPLRAKFIAETYLENYKLVNSVRNIFGYTGWYKGKRITVFASGMGMPSMGIYCYELYKFFDVQNIIRIGTSGSFHDDIEILDIVLSTCSYTEGNFAYSFSNEKCNLVESSEVLNQKLIAKAKQLNIPLKQGMTFCGECFDAYLEHSDELIKRLPKEILSAEMEAFALFYIAKKLNKNASCLMTVSDSIKHKKSITSEQRQKSLTEMIELALETFYEMED